MTRNYVTTTVKDKARLHEQLSILSLEDRLRLVTNHSSPCNITAAQVTTRIMVVLKPSNHACSTTMNAAATWVRL